MSRLSKLTALALVDTLAEALDEVKSQYAERCINAQTDDEWLKWSLVLQQGQRELGVHDLPPEWFDAESPKGKELSMRRSNIVDGFNFHYQAPNAARRILAGWYRGKRASKTA